MLSIPHDPHALTRPLIEAAAHRFLDLGVGAARAEPHRGCVLVRSAELGAYVVTQDHKNGGRWVDAFWGADAQEKVVDVTGAGNSFLGGVAAALSLAGGDMYEGGAGGPGALNSSYASPSDPVRLGISIVHHRAAGPAAHGGDGGTGAVERGGTCRPAARAQGAPSALASDA
jgi:sugar/nucleoside kinase (ribokinase family)